MLYDELVELLKVEEERLAKYKAKMAKKGANKKLNKHAALADAELEKLEKDVEKLRPSCQERSFEPLLSRHDGAATSPGAGIRHLGGRIAGPQIPERENGICSDVAEAMDIDTAEAI